ncbi:MAG: sensor histidine kinase [Parabacteroides sp.]
MLLFTAFVTFSYWYNRPFRLERPQPLHHQQWRETPPDRFRPSTPERFHGPKKPRHGLPNPVVLDGMIALLLMGSDLALGLLIQSAKEKRRLEVLEHERLQQELDGLKAQINPHFLMNVLNNIHGMVEIEPQKAQTMIVELSALMRYVLYEGACQYIDVLKEMHFISNYIALMSKRYSSRRVQIDLQLPETVPPGRTVPPLLFLVLIENAFKHGISYRKLSTLQFTVTLSEERIVLTCINNRINRSEVPAKEGGIGLVNLRKRLQLLFDDNYRFDIEETEVYYKSTLEIPMRKI